MERKGVEGRGHDYNGGGGRRNNRKGKKWEEGCGRKKNREVEIRGRERNGRMDVDERGRLYLLYSLVPDIVVVNCLLYTI